MVKAIPILFAILGMTAFMHSLRWAQNRRAHIYAVAAANYIAAAVIFIWWCVFANTQVHFDVIIRGIAIGGLYGAAFFLLMHGISVIGVSKTSVIVNLAQAIPVLASIVIWQERPGILLTAGIVAAAISIPLIFLPASGGSSAARPFSAAIFSMTLLYFAQGAAYTVMKSFERLERPQEKPVLLAALFITAAVITSVILIIMRAKADGKDLLHGIFTGCCNAVSNIALVSALALAAGTVVFPTVTAGTIIAVTILSIILWKERYRSLTWLGLFVAVVSMILINL